MLSVAKIIVDQHSVKNFEIKYILKQLKLTK